MNLHFLPVSSIPCPTWVRFSLSLSLSLSLSHKQLTTIFYTFFCPSPFFLSYTNNVTMYQHPPCFRPFLRVFKCHFTVHIIKTFHSLSSSFSSFSNISSSCLYIVILLLQYLFFQPLQCSCFASSFHSLPAPLIQLLQLSSSSPKVGSQVLLAKQGNER